MGLDMYARATDAKPKRPVDFKDDGTGEFHYWRKHPNLHGWMEALYRQKGGAAETFNCVTLALDTGDLDRLEADIKAERLPESGGFFFGATDGSERDDDLEFIAKARQHLIDGLTVYYTSW